LEIGVTQKLIAARTTDNGCYLKDDEGNEVLLPNAYVSPELQLGDTVEVFVYKDNEQRPVATTLKPKLEVEQFAYLEVKEVNNVGAFLDWGLVKQLMVPFAEQTVKMEEGKSYVVYLHLDEKTERLIGSAKINEFLFFDDITVETGDKVDLLFYKKTDLGINAIVNGMFQGLVFHGDIHQQINIGDKMEGYVKNVRDDGKLDLSLMPVGYRQAIDPNTRTVLDALKNNDGVLMLHDKSDPHDIRTQLGMSKKMFKKTLGYLYKWKKIEILDDSIKLVQNK
jgi:predicted RNA-binding protein (virulence factor B family)